MSKQYYMESYSDWNIKPEVGEIVFVLTGRSLNPSREEREGFVGKVLKIFNDRAMVTRKVPSHLRHFFKNETVSEIHYLNKLRILKNNKNRLDQIKELRGIRNAAMGN